jgi:hypothetical protein
VTSDVTLGTLVRSALPAVPVVNLMPGIRKSGTSDLDGLERRRPPLEIRREHVTAYARVCAFPEKDTVPVTYPHLLGFGLQLHVMADPASRSRRSAASISPTRSPPTGPSRWARRSR